LGPFLIGSKVEVALFFRESFRQAEQDHPGQVAAGENSSCFSGNRNNYSVLVLRKAKERIDRFRFADVALALPPTPIRPGPAPEP
jgi:hypothetical protein